jgi:hypothetical protein
MFHAAVVLGALLLSACAQKSEPLVPGPGAPAGAPKDRHIVLMVEEANGVCYPSGAIPERMPLFRAAKAIFHVFNYCSNPATVRISAVRLRNTTPNCQVTNPFETAAPQIADVPAGGHDKTMVPVKTSNQLPDTCLTIYKYDVSVGNRTLDPEVEIKQ